MALGKRIRSLREARGLSQFELSELTGGVVSQGAISALEKRDSTASKFADLIAKALNVQIADLFNPNLQSFKPEPMQFDVKDFQKYADKLNSDEKQQMHELLNYFVNMSKQHKKLTIQLTADFYDIDTKLAKIARMRPPPAGLIEGKDNDGRIERKKA
jgi:transcriptional regulator with XRE-family HTH domain